jgi:DNA polymerase I
MDDVLREDPIFENKGTRLLLQIHDELVYEVRDELVEYFQLTMEETMTTCIALDVPLAVNM